jgi:predicted nucleic acid-binding protein
MAARHQRPIRIAPAKTRAVLAFIAGHPLDQLYVSAVTLAELRFGIEILSEGTTHREDLNHWLTRVVRPMFEQRVLQVTEDIMLKWRDLIIATTAMHHGLTLVTRD